MTPTLELRHLTRRLPSGGRALTILDDVSLSIEAGEFAAILGPSGSGKSTLLALMAGLDRPTSGEVLVDGEAIQDLSEDELALLRRRKIGFVFQSFQLLPALTALENVMLPLELASRADAEEAARAILARVGLAERLGHYPKHLSGGEQQRVALARAFVVRPKLLLADEPTGSLDTESGDSVIELMFELNRSYGTTLVMVTHDELLAQRCARVVRLAAGRIVESR